MIESSRSHFFLGCRNAQCGAHDSCLKEFFQLKNKIQLKDRRLAWQIQIRYIREFFYPFCDRETVLKKREKSAFNEFDRRCNIVLHHQFAFVNFENILFFVGSSDSSGGSTLPPF